MSLRTGAAEKVIDLPGGFSTSMAGGSSGSFLIVSVADSGGRGSLQRRDPVSGALLASHPTEGVTAASVGGVIDSGVRAAQPTGMQGFIQRYRTSTLAPVSGTAVEGSNGVGVVVANRLAWVLRPGRLPRRVVFTPATVPDNLRAGISLESVVLLDEAGNASGTADKSAVHHDRTPLHLAFSCYLFNEAGQFLLTRRAESKRTFPGVWTNTCCGHPMPGESVPGSVRRRLQTELGIGSARLELVLPRFRYQARMANGVLENELCPVYAAYAGPAPLSPEPAPAEVAETRWVDWEDFCEAVRAGRQPVSPWCAMQLAELAALGPGPLQWVPADPAGLPPAAIG